MKKLLFFFKELKSTFWFVPGLIMIASILLAVIILNVDNTITFKQEGLGKYFFIGSAESARSILSTISAAMIGVAGTVFSVTLVVLTLATSQFGSRLVKNFMYVRLNQVVLGTYISTYLYCLIILNTIAEKDNVVFIPSLSILVALFAAVVNIVLLIVFIHKISVGLQADKVISDISKSIAKDVKVLFPEELKEEHDKQAKKDKGKKSDYNFSIKINSPKDGYLQYIDGDALLGMMSENECLLELFVRPGDYLVNGVEVCNLHAGEKVDEKIVKQIQSNFVVGSTRSPQQDIGFSIHKMVEVAVRALSPGVNDPYTAIACIDYLTSTLSHLAKVKFPPKYRNDENGNLRIIARTLEYEGVIDTAFNQIRQFSAGSPAVIIRLAEALDTIFNVVEKPEHKNAIIKHAEMVLRVGNDSIKEKNDLNDLKEKLDFILKKSANSRSTK